ncbi:MAG: hypothetical protein ACI4PM_02545 [Butyricicoccus sp.]
MSYSAPIAEAIRAFLTHNKWNFSFNEEKGIFTFRLAVKNALQHVTYAICVQDSSYIIFLTAPFRANPDTRTEMAEFLCCANFGLALGNFEMDAKEGQIRFRCFTDCQTAVPCAKTIRDSILSPASVMNHFGEAMNHVHAGTMTAQEALESIR